DELDHPELRRREALPATGRTFAFTASPSKPGDGLLEREARPFLTTSVEASIAQLRAQRALGLCAAPLVGRPAHETHIRPPAVRGAEDPRRLLVALEADCDYGEQVQRPRNAQQEFSLHPERESIV